MPRRSFRHWSPRYLRDRVALWWYEGRHADAPWLTRTATRFLDGWLRRSDAGFEWGAGRSTLWLARRIASLTSVEHDPQWFARLSLEIQSRAVRNVRFSLCSLEGDEQSPYVQAIEAYPQGTLEFVLVDGRLRDACVKAALSRIRPGGLLILDNADRYFPVASGLSLAREHTPEPSWREIETQLASWTRLWTTNGVFDTALFIKPHE